MKHAFLVTAAVLLLNGCATSPFSGTDAANAAKIRITNTNNDKYHMRLTTREAGTCKDKDFVVWITGGRETDARRVGMYDSPPVKEGVVELLVPAGMPLQLIAPSSAKLDAFTTITALGISQDYVRSLIPAPCKVPDFTPERNQQYEINIHPEPQKCTVTVNRLAASGAAIERVTLAHEVISLACK